MQAEIAHQRVEKPSKTAFEEFCDEFPEFPESRMYDL